jgi:hypothetical protein
MATELIELTKKQLQHLRELGVEGIDIRVTAPEPGSTETFEQIHADIGNCTRCPLSQDRTHVVHTEGNRKARLMFVGEAPGADEDAQARPLSAAPDSCSPRSSKPSA